MCPTPNRSLRISCLITLLLCCVSCVSSRESRTATSLRVQSLRPRNPLPSPTATSTSCDGSSIATLPSGRRSRPETSEDLEFSAAADSSVTEVIRYERIESGR